jgi:hypothetical protein
MCVAASLLVLSSRRCGSSQTAYRMTAPPLRLLLPSVGDAS